MTDKVVDASAIAAVLFNEPKQAAVITRLASCTLLAPSLITFELANVCIKKIRVQPSDRDAIVRMHRTYARFAVTNMPVDFFEVCDLAEECALSAYDASYLWLAHTLRIELVTLDAKLERAAKTI